MFERLIKNRPNLIVLYTGSKESLFELAINNGYIPNEMDLIRNKQMRESTAIRKKALENNPKLIKYFEKKITEEIIDDAMDRGYIPTLEDLERNNELGKSTRLINYLIDNGYPESIKYCKSGFEATGMSAFSFVSDGVNVKKALEGYTPTVEDIINNRNLGKFSSIMMTILKQDINAIKYIGFDDKFLIELALFNGYEPNLRDVKNNEILAKNSKIFKKLIQKDCNNILFYRGNDQEIFDLAIENGYVPTLDDLEKNYALGHSDKILDILLEQDSSIILKYFGFNEDIFEKAYNLGFNESKIISKIEKKSYDYQFYNILSSKFVIKKLIDYDYKYTKYYKGSDLDVYSYAFEKGYRPTEDDYKKFNFNIDFFKLLLSYDPKCIKKFDGRDKTVLVERAIEIGIIPDEEDIIQIAPWYLNEYIIPKIINVKPEYIKYYSGNNMDFYKNAINAGYYPNEEVIKENSLLNSNFDIMILVVKNNPEYIKYYSGYDMFALKALTTEYIPTYEEVNSSYRVRSNYILMKKLINIDSKYVELVDYQVGQKEYIELYELAIDLGYKLNFEKIQNNYWLFSSDKIMEELIKIDSNFILKYNGTNIKIFELAINLGYEPWKDYKSILQYCKYEQEAKKINLLIANFIKTKDFSMLKESEINQMYDYYRLLKIAIEFGYEPSIEEINSITIKAFDDNLLMKIIDSSSEEECINLIFRASLNEVLKDYIRKSKNINISDEYFYLLRDYNFDRAKLIYNYEKFQDILEQINIDESKFIQYGIAISYDWFTDMLKIYDSNKIDEFNTVKKYFFDNYYFKNESDYSDVYLVKCIINILKNYIKYPELCLNIVNNNIQLDLNIIDNIKFIFENNATIEDNIKPKTVEDLKNIENLFITKYKNDLENIEFKDIEEIKNTLCQLLFNANYYDILNRLSIYGNTKDLRQLLFNNRNNFEIVDDIAEMMIYTSMMEAIINSNDKAYLTETVKRVLENYKLSAKCLMLFNQFEDKMRELYENELIANLTNLDEDLKESILDKGMSNLYGIDVIDLSTKKYCLLEHTKSPSETVEELVLGKSSGDKNTICLSVGSHRNQLLYSSYNRIIFATDSIPNNSFIRSSISNMGSNGSVVNNSFEDNGSFNVRTQRGAIETSQAVRGNNSEVLCFRSDIKFKYIVLPGGRSPTQEELDIAKNYNLKFIKVQELNKTIENPVDLDEKEKNEKLSQSETIELEKLKEVKEKLLSISSGPRKIAIFSDVHALFEPTLAILEDAKKNGISEIYSLGDNIGTGPNPREVLELLKEYNVKSLKGNHEIYTVDGIDELKEHLGKTGAYEEAKRNSTWTREQLTEELLSKIKDDKEYRTIEVGGKKVLLTHYTKDYNTGEVRDLPVADEVFQGHIHFEGQNDKLNTLRGAGIGHKDSDTHKAYYLILTERTDGGYDIEKRYVDYDYDSLYHDINESDMAKEDKNKIENWAGVQRK